MSYQALSLTEHKRIVLVKKSASFQCIMTMPLLGQFSDVCARIQSPFAGPSCHVIHILHNASIPLQFQTKLGCWMDFAKLCGYLSMTTSSHESTIKSPDYRLILGQYLCLYSQTPIKRGTSFWKRSPFMKRSIVKFPNATFTEKNDRSVLIPLWLLQLSLLHRQETR